MFVAFDSCSCPLSAAGFFSFTCEPRLGSSIAPLLFIFTLLLCDKLVVSEDRSPDFSEWCFRFLELLRVSESTGLFNEAGSAAETNYNCFKHFLLRIFDLSRIMLSHRFRSLQIFRYLFENYSLFSDIMEVIFGQYKHFTRQAPIISKYRISILAMQ